MRPDVAEQRPRPARVLGDHHVDLAQHLGRSRGEVAQVADGGRHHVEGPGPGVRSGAHPGAPPEASKAPSKSSKAGSLAAPGHGQHVEADVVVERAVAPGPVGGGRHHPQRLPPIHRLLRSPVASSRPGSGPPRSRARPPARQTRSTSPRRVAWLRARTTYPRRASQAAARSSAPAADSPGSWARRLRRRGRPPPGRSGRRVACTTWRPLATCLRSAGQHPARTLGQDAERVLEDGHRLAGGEPLLGEPHLQDREAEVPLRRRERGRGDELPARLDLEVPALVDEEVGEPLRSSAGSTWSDARLQGAQRRPGAERQVGRRPLHERRAAPRRAGAGTAWPAPAPRPAPRALGPTPPPAPAGRSPAPGSGCRARSPPSRRSASAPAPQSPAGPGPARPRRPSSRPSPARW